jgi:hypothetical protein
MIDPESTVLWGFLEKAAKIKFWLLFFVIKTGIHAFDFVGRCSCSISLLYFTGILKKAVFDFFSVESLCFLRNHMNCMVVGLH